MPTGALPVPPALLRSPLVARLGGFAVYEGLPDHTTFSQLFNEALEAYGRASVQESWEPDHEDVRGGTPRRSLLSSEAGPVQDSLYGSGTLLELLSSVCGMPIVPSGNRGSYSYYVWPGDFLDVHRDVETCDVAVITSLHDNTAATDQAGALVLYPRRIHEPLSAIRSRPGEGAHPVKLMAGQTLIMVGGLIPHCVLPVVSGQVRIISALCFQALPQDTRSRPARSPAKRPRQAPRASRYRASGPRT